MSFGILNLRTGACEQPGYSDRNPRGKKPREEVTNSAIDALEILRARLLKRGTQPEELVCFDAQSGQMLDPIPAGISFAWRLTASSGGRDGKVTTDVLFDDLEAAQDLAATLRRADDTLRLAATVAIEPVLLRSSVEHMSSCEYTFQIVGDDPTARSEELVRERLWLSVDAPALGGRPPAQPEVKLEITAQGSAAPIAKISVYGRSEAECRAEADAAHADARRQIMERFQLERVEQVSLRWSTRETAPEFTPLATTNAGDSR